ncbi:MAG: carboxypeptidase-like regulatory domain-containing protein, partial [Candidatus Thermoplasmatota archaeon]|nr:carboxypeptidase-like regulatory domain-containing protein [Candidatus Thermoplasmatota archaeon]
QMYQRNIFTQAVDAWNELSREQQEAYNRIATPYGISGFNLFVRRYIELARADEKYYAPVTAEIKVIDEERHPVEKATVIIKKGRAIVYQGFTDEEGKCTLALTKEDEPYDVNIVMPGYETIVIPDMKIAQLSKTFTLKVLPPVIDP